MFANASTTLTVYTDFVCPWCYLSTPRIARLRRQYAIDLDWVFFPLHPETPDEGLPLEQLFAGRGYDLAAMHRAMAGRMADEGLPYRERTHTYNTRLAQELARWAGAQAADGAPEPEAIHQALYEAYFVAGQNLADPAVLVRVAESVGLSGVEAGNVIERRSFRSEIDRDWQEARLRGITGVPTFASRTQAVVGAHPYETLEQLVLEAGASPLPNPDA